MTTNVYLPLDICKERILCFTRSTITTARLIGTNVTHIMFPRPQQNMIIPMYNMFLHVTIFQTNSEKSLTNKACFEEYISETYTNRISEAVNRFHAFWWEKAIFILSQWYSKAVTESAQLVLGMDKSHQSYCNNQQPRTRKKLNTDNSDNRTCKVWLTVGDLRQHETCL